MELAIIMARNFLLIVLLLVSSFSTFAMENKTFCVWDPVGRNGPVMTFYSDVIPKAQAWGLNINFIAFTDELRAAKEFKAGRCEAVVLTSILSRQFVKFAGTMDAIGAINSQEGLELAIATLARERAGNLMTQDNYEVVTTAPVGSMYAFVNDRSIDEIDDFAGKTLAILNGDPQMKKFADLAGSSQVDVTLEDFAGQFNSGSIDIVIMPALAYNTFELYRGLGTTGGILDYRLYYGMLQTIAKRDQFPEDFGAKMRSYMLTRLKAIDKMVLDAEKEIPAKYWIKTKQSVKDDIDHFSKRVRLALRDDKVNNETALKLFWKIRCRLDPSRGECKESPYKKSKRDKDKEKKKAKMLKQAKQAKKLTKEKQPILTPAKQEALNKEKLAIQKEKEKLAQEIRDFEQAKLALEEEIKRFEQEKLELQKAKKTFELERLDSEAKMKNRTEAKLETSIDAKADVEPVTEVEGEAETASETESEPKEQGSWWSRLFG